MKALEYLKSIGIIENENSKFLIKFEDGREFDLVKILETFEKESLEELIAKICLDKKLDVNKIAMIKAVNSIPNF